ncbi:MAG: hypothetical protein JNJ73_02610 [Hyphomonadaceae bacterium]|nr:hypothetical protein [Hyphomonadaceae bacterium]
MIDPQLQSQLLLAFAGALMGALFGGFARWGGSHADRRLRLTLDLYSEFHSPKFNHIRILAHEALERAGKMPRAYEASAGEPREAIASVVHFWEKTALLASEGALDMRLLKRFLGQYAKWWRPLLCEGEAKSDPEWGRTLTDISWLFDRIERGEGRR